MALTKTPIELSSTPSIVDGGNATAITIGSDESVTLAGTFSLPNANATNEISFTGTDFTNVLSATTSGFQLGTTGAGYLQFFTSNTARMTIDGGTGNVGIGLTPSAAYKLQVAVATNTVSTGSPAASSIANISGGTTTVGDGVSLQLTNTSGAKETAWRISAVTTSGNNGDLVFNGYAGGSDYPERMRIASSGMVTIDGFSTTGLMLDLVNTNTSTDKYSQMRFTAGTALNYIWGANQNSTSWAGANSLNIQSSSGAIGFFTSGSTLRMKIHESSGNIDIPNGNLSFAAGHGIDFSATSDAAGRDGELLDDYEEGYWTPVAVGSTGGTSTMGQALGSYTKIGNLVHLTWYIGISGGNATGSINLTGLPYHALHTGTTNSRITTGSCMFDSLLLPSGKTVVSPYMSHGASTMQFYSSGSNLGWTTVPVDSVWSMIGGITYRTI
tara:strand:+ start:725 stop:2050 length:1326 start_codon:yes stop_codon:yes gene_type:complete